MPNLNKKDLRKAAVEDAIAIVDNEFIPICKQGSPAHYINETLLKIVKNLNLLK
jgi:hypothetical protein